MKTSLLLTLTWLASLTAAQAEPAARPSVHFGCQARTFGEGVYKDEAAFLNVVRQVGAIGFEGLETNAKNLERYYERPADFAQILKNAHLKLIGAHLGGSPWNAAVRQKTLADAGRAARFVNQMGGQFIVLSSSLPKPRPLPPDTWPQMAQFVNEIGRVCQQSGVRCLYHNHWVECEGDGMETLCRLTDPKLVGFAFDTGHALHAGKDPAALVGVLGDRLGIVHFSDYAEQGPAIVKRPALGSGSLNIPALAAALRNAGFNQWIVLEEESAVGGGRTLAEKGLAVFRTAFPPSK